MTGLDIVVDGGALWLTLDRPEVGNAVNRAVQVEMIEQLAAASADPTTRVVVLGARGGRHFCTGPDLSDPELRPDPQRSAGDAARRLRLGSQSVVSAILDCEKPVVCALNGTAAGVGASMALACDLIVAASNARLIELFVRRGLAPDGGAAYLLARKLPLNLAKELLLFGGELSVEDAHRLGLVNKIVSPDALRDEVAEWVARLASSATRALVAAKAMLNQSLDVDRVTAFATEALLVEQVVGTRDSQEGVAAFLERRPARFDGR